MCFYKNPCVATLPCVRKVSIPVERSPLWCLQVLSGEIALESGSSAFRLFGFRFSDCRFLGFRPMSAGKDATEEFDMLHDRKVIKKYGIDEGTVVLKGTLSKWMWRMRPAMVATFAVRPHGHFSAFSNWSSSSKPFWGSGWLSPLLMMTREKIWKTCEMSFSTCTLAQHCRILPGTVDCSLQLQIPKADSRMLQTVYDRILIIFVCCALSMAHSFRIFHMTIVSWFFSYMVSFLWLWLLRIQWHLKAERNRLWPVSKSLLSALSALSAGYFALNILAQSFLIALWQSDFPSSKRVSMSVSADEVAKHNTDKDCWVIVGDQVLDVTNFLSDLAKQSGAELLSNMILSPKGYSML